MDRLNRFSSTITTIGLGIGVLLAKFAPEWLFSQSIPALLSVVLAFIIITISYLVFRFLSSFAVESWKGLRALLLGNMFVEGTWIETITCSGNEQFIGIGHFDYYDGSLQFSGENLKKDGYARGAFVADTLSVTWPVIRYYYSWTRHASPRHATNGYGEVHFTKREGRPKRYQGFFVDIEDAKRHDFMGYRIEDKDILKKLDDPEEHKKIVQEFAKKNIPLAEDIKNL